jgi:preprotein translocase subunit Sec63
MIFKEEYIEESNEEFIVEHLVFSYNGNELILERTQSEPEDDMWNNTEVEIYSYDGDEPLTDEEEEEIINRCFDGDYDYE